MTVSYVSCSFVFRTFITVSYGYHFTYLYLHPFPSSLHMSQYYPTHNISSFHPDTPFRRIVNRTCCNAHVSRGFASRALYQTRKKMALQWLNYRHPCSKIFRSSTWGYRGRSTVNWHNHSNWQGEGNIQNTSILAQLMVCDGTKLLMRVHNPSINASKSESEVGVQSHQEMCPWKYLIIFPETRW